MEVVDFGEVDVELVLVVGVVVVILASLQQTVNVLSYGGPRPILSRHGCLVFPVSIPRAQASQQF